jgi:hypothetical protein
MLSVQIYRVFLVEKLPEMLEEILLALKTANMWFHHDGTVANFARHVWNGRVCGLAS